VSTIPIYVALAAGMFLLAGVLLRRARAEEATEEKAEENPAQALWDARSLSLAERLFDSAVYLWLRRTIGFPDLARKLARSRKRMALKWLRSLRKAFDELVSTPDAAAGHQPEEHLRGWHLLWLTLRFQLLVGYAILMVRMFGPYHRLLPSLPWITLPADTDYQRRTYQPAGTGRVP